jgi:coenzyme Q-binding protein COQ10
MPGWPGSAEAPGARSPVPKHEDHRRLPYRPDQLYALVADIERYPEFLPWCIGARIRERRPTEIVADLVIGFKMYRERFTSRVTLHEPDGIEVTYSEGPFRYLNNSWRFQPAPGGGTQLDFQVDFELKSRLRSTRRGWSARAAEAAIAGKQSTEDSKHYAQASSSMASARSTVARRICDRSPAKTCRSCRVAAPRRASPKWTSPTGLPGVAPVGPAMPVTETARSTRSSRASTPSAMARATASLTAP